MHTTLLMPGAYARRPLCDRFLGMDWARGPSGVAFVYGDANDWMERSAAEAVRDGVHGMKQRVAVCRVAGAGLNPTLTPTPTLAPTLTPTLALTRCGPQRAARQSSGARRRHPRQRDPARARRPSVWSGGAAPGRRVAGGAAGGHTGGLTSVGFAQVHLHFTPPAKLGARGRGTATHAMLRPLLLLLLADVALGLRVPSSRPRASAAMAMSSADRRTFLSQAAAVSGLCLSDLSGLPAYAADQRPVLVLGASGGTGRACVDYLLAQGRPCIAATRTGEYDAPASPLLTVARALASS